LIQFEKDSKQPDEDFSLLKVELEDAKKIKDIMKQQLSEKKARCEASGTRSSEKKERNGEFSSLV
jgi:hypothetical protein